MRPLWADRMFAIFRFSSAAVVGFASSALAAPRTRKAEESERLAGAVTGLAGLAALAIALAFPAAYLLSANNRLMGVIEVRAQIYGEQVTDTASQNPELWNAFFGDAKVDLTGLAIAAADDAQTAGYASEHRRVFAGNGRDAVQHIVDEGSAAFDLVLMDVQMPEMDGYEATRRIRALAPDLPVVGQTAHVCDEERAKCLSAGMVAHIAKPIDPRQLVSVIRQHTGHRRGHSAAAGVSGSDRIAVSSDTTGPNAECPPC
jgi:CheY-like chemotaxis protein